MSGRSLPTRKGLHFFVLHDVSWSIKKKRERERLAFVCVSYSGKCSLESRSRRQCQSAAAVVGWTGLQSLRSLLTAQADKKGTVSEDKGKSLPLS